jgi:hypothetical protein
VVGVDSENESRPLHPIEEDMLTTFAGQRTTAASLCELLNEKYTEVECLDALQFLEKKHAILVDPVLKDRESSAIP